MKNLLNCQRFDLNLLHFEVRKRYINEDVSEVVIDEDISMGIFLRKAAGSLRLLNTGLVHSICQLIL